MDAQTLAYNLNAALKFGDYSVPLFNKEGLGEILLDKSPAALALPSPFFKGGGECLLNLSPCFIHPIKQNTMCHHVKDSTIIRVLIFINFIIMSTLAVGLLNR